MASVELGRTATDKVTGFKGVITGVCFYLSGCNQALLMPRVGSDGAHRDGQWFDVQRLDVDADADAIVLDNGGTPGFDKAAPKR